VQKTKLLVFPCGSEIGLEIQKALKYAKYIELWGGSSVRSNHGKFVYKNYIGDLPHVDDSNFLENLNKIIKKYDFDMIYPAYDEINFELNKKSDSLKAEIIGSPFQTLKLTRSKSQTYSYFKGKLAVPVEYSSVNEIEIGEYPIFIKPDQGHGSEDTHIAQDRERAEFYLRNNENLIMLEYLEGKEYTIDCFTDYTGELRFIGGRERKRIRNGISVDAIPIENKEIAKFAEVINAELNLNGAWFFQLKEDNSGKLKLLEIGPRIAGTMALYRNLGVNFPLLSFYNAKKIDIDIVRNDYPIEIDRALKNKFDIGLDYDHIYIDLDDCLINNGKVNSQIIKFIYDSINNNLQINLITKHNGNLKDKLKQNRLENVFDQILHIRQEESKSDYISENNAILIDDSFSERKEVSEKCNIPVFSPDMVESLEV